MIKFIVSILSLVLITACASKQKDQQSAEEANKAETEMVKAKIDKSTVLGTLESWPTKPRQVATKMMDKYGPPNEATPSMMIWLNNSPWARTIVYREEIAHSFPRMHMDVLEQVVSYKVPPEKFDDLARFDGSIIVERTKGTLAARSDSEEMNFLALNLAKEIIDGRMNVVQARTELGRSAMVHLGGGKNDYLNGLKFSSMDVFESADTDVNVMRELMGEESSATGGTSE